MKLKLLFILLFALSCSQEPAKTKDVKIPRDYSAFIQKALAFCEQKKLNTSWFMLADMAVHSGKKRFFIYNFKSERFTDTFLVSHGCGNHVWLQDDTRENPVFSNKEDSHCSALGKYILRDRGTSIFGVKTKYLLEGVDETNNNAMRRAIVFHSLNEVSDTETYPRGTPEGWGCPAISNNAFLDIDRRLKNESNNTLLWLIN
jgi:L,D-transpeptidase catalytic domain